MVLLPYLDLLQACFQLNDIRANKKILNMLYNSSIDICFTKRYIELIEQELTNKDLFQSLITELSDENRLKIEKTNPKSSIDDEFVEIALSAKIPLLLPVVKIDENNCIKKIPFLTILNEAKPMNRHWLIVELLSNNICNISYQDFKNDSEILTFFDIVFSIPRYMTVVYIFDREQNPRLLSKLKGNKIQFYTLLKGGKHNEYIRKQIKNELRKQLGGRLSLYFTNNPRLLHERKIIFENIILTLDNSHNNLTTAEPTWEIVITYNKDKSNKWQAKCGDFYEVYS